MCAARRAARLSSCRMKERTRSAAEPTRAHNLISPAVIFSFEALHLERLSGAVSKRSAFENSEALAQDVTCWPRANLCVTYVS